MSTVQLRRVDEAQNMRRFYSLRVQPDLFGCFWLVREFGRLGSPGRVMEDQFASLDEAAAAHAQLWKEKLRGGYSAH